MRDVALRTAAAFAALFAVVMPANAADNSPVLQKIKVAGAIAIGYRDSAIPMSYLDAQQQPIGFSIELCGLIANQVKQTLGMADLKINYVPVTLGDRASQVQNGTVDLVCEATPVTPDLQQQVGFSTPIFTSELRWIVPRKFRVEREGRRRRRTEIISPSSSEDLKGKTIALTQGSPATSLVLTLSNERSLGLSIVEGKDNADSFHLVETGRASAFLADDVILAGTQGGCKEPRRVWIPGGRLSGHSLRADVSQG